jgi:hypothetical protein
LCALAIAVAAWQWHAQLESRWLAHWHDFSCSALLHPHPAQHGPNRDIRGKAIEHRRFEHQTIFDTGHDDSLPESQTYKARIALVSYWLSRPSEHANGQILDNLHIA